MRPGSNLFALAALLLAACATPATTNNAPATQTPAAALGAAELAADPHAMVIHFLDVGQGAATLLEFPCGAALIDTGGEQNDEFHSVPLLKRALDEFFARRTDLNRTLDLLLLTHPHIDHMRGVPMVLGSYTVKNIVDNGLPGERPVAAEEDVLRKTIAQRAIHYRPIHRAEIDARTGLTDAVIDPISCATTDPVIRVLSGGLSEDPGWPPDSHGKSAFHNMNNHSVVVRVDFGKSSLLITGDLEDAGIHDLIEKYQGSRLLDVDVYEVGHHGSYNATTHELISAMTPKVAVIEMGSKQREETWSAWTYGHPRKSVVDMLAASVSLAREPTTVSVATEPKTFVSLELEKAVYGTGWDGPVDVKLSDDGAISVSLLHGPAAAP